MTMKPKAYEKEIIKSTDKMISEFKTLIALSEAYDKCSSLKRQEKFCKKLEKRYGKEIEKLEKRIDNIDFSF